MKLSLRNARLTNLLQQRNMMTATAAGLLALNFVQAFLVMSKDERVVVVPPDVRQEFWVKQNKVSASYLEEMAILYADLILENTPSGAAYRRDVVLRNVASEGYGSLKTKLLEDEKRLKKEHLSTSFQTNKVKVDPKSLTVEISGDLIRYVGKKRISQSRDTYQFEFNYNRGKLLIKTFQLIKSDKHED